MVQLAEKYVDFYTGKDGSAHDQFLQITRAFSILEDTFATLPFGSYVLKSGDTMSGVLNTVGLLPVADTTSDIGSSALRYKDIYSSNLEIIGGSKTSTAATTVTRGANSKIIAFVRTTSTGQITLTSDGGSTASATLIGFASNTGTGLVTWTATGAGSINLASAAANNANNATAISTGTGSYLGGYAQSISTRSAVLESTGSSSFVHVYALGATARATAQGANTTGYATNNGILEALAPGSKVGGYVHTATISCTAGGSGGEASGYANGGAGANITVSALGGKAGGNAAAGNAITASGNGGLAWGDSTAGPISATAVNSVQFGPGVNAEVDTLKVGGAGLRMKGTIGPPGVVVNGDMWVDGAGVVWIQSGGIACACTFPAM